MLLSFFLVACCAHSPPTSAQFKPLPPVRFLLTFDDGPSPASEDNPTASIAATLARNTVQPGIKAVFFVQTRWSGAGGSPAGHALLRQLAAQGHVLGIHSGSVKGHYSHIRMNASELVTSLQDGSDDITASSGEVPQLVRPPYWEYNDGTLDLYRQAGLGVLLTDVSARDGSAVLLQVDPHDGGRIRCDLACVRQRLEKERIPLVDGVAPVVMTFHDPNRYTARHLTDYLASLLWDARKMGLTLATPAFYVDRAALMQAAQARVVPAYIPLKRLLTYCNE